MRKREKSMTKIIENRSEFIKNEFKINDENKEDEPETNTTPKGGTWMSWMSGLFADVCGYISIYYIIFCRVHQYI